MVTLGWIVLIILGIIIGILVIGKLIGLLFAILSDASGIIFALILVALVIFFVGGGC